MEFRQFSIKGLVEITPRLFKDERGLFFESYSEKIFRENGIDAVFVQDNQSFSLPNVLRGLHFQNPPYAQGKLVRVIKGRAIDVAVDIRAGSPTFGQHQSVILDSEKCNMFYIPEGFAHGFLALEETILSYKCTNFYNKASESGIIWNDPDLGIDWNVSVPLVSEKDKELGRLKDLKIS
ncbi:MAG: dTDP-4-dehydrorhamnose 3,5-epimerase [Cytophagaceae bacterium]